MGNKSFQDITIPCYDTDEACRMRPAAFLNYAQELAGDNAEMLGFGYDDLIKDDLVWIISRIRAEFVRMPLWREKTRLSTWHRGCIGPFYVRDSLLEDLAGNTLARMTSSWAVLNLTERKVVRDLEAAMNPATMCPDVALDPPCSRMRLPRDIGMTLVTEHKVVYSDIDKNRHVNNVRYVDWAMDALDLGLVKSAPVRELEIDFIMEAREGDVVTLSTGRAADTQAIYVEGTVEGRTSFIARFVFEK